MKPKINIIFTNFKIQIIALISTLIFIGSTLGNVNDIFDFTKKFIFSDNIDSKIQGIWLSKYSYPVSGGTLEVHGTTEYFKNKNYNFVGEIGIIVVSEEGSILIKYRAEGTGVWQTDLESITTRLNDLKSWPKSVLYNDKPLDLHLSKLILGEDFPNIEESLPVGLNEEFEVEDISENKIVLKTDAPNGTKYKFTMVKQTKRFQI